MAVRSKVLHDVFISYAHRDEARAKEVCAALEADGLRCWIAPRDIRSGVPYAQALVDAIAGSRIVVVVFSEAANRSGGVLNELEIAFNRDLPMLAVRIDAYEPSGSAEFYLRRHQWFEADREELGGTRAVSRAVRDAIAAATPQRARAPRRTASRSLGVPDRPLLAGRDDELTFIAHTVRAAAEGIGSMIVFSGEPGIGKTRLLEAALDDASAGGFLVARAVNFEHARAPLGPWIDILRTFEDQAPNVVPSNAADRSAYQRLTGADERGTGPAPDRRRLFVIIAEALERASQRQPLFVAIDDAQWADPETVELLDFLAPRLSGARMLVFVTRRAGNADPTALALARIERYPTVTVRELTRISDEAVRQIVATMPAEEHIKGSTIEEICRRSDGNPLFALSLARDATTGAGHLLPRSMQLSAVSRLESLPGPDARIIETASVIGRIFSLDDLVAIAGDDRVATLRAIRNARDAGLVEEAGADGTTYAFAHELFRAAAYETLLIAERREIHRAFAERRATSHDAPAALLAYHFQRAGFSERACVYAIAAGDEAMQLKAFASARDAYDEALQTGTLHGGEEAAVRVKAAAAREALGDSDAAAKQFAEVIAYYRQAGEHDEAARYELSFASNAYRAGRGDEVLHACDNVLATTQRPPLLYGAHAILASFYAFRGMADRARDHIDAADRIGPVGVARDVLSTEWARAAASSDETGEEALAAARRAVTIAEAEGSPSLLGVNLMNFAIGARRAGREDEADRALDRAVDIADANGVTYTAAYARCFQAVTLHFHGSLQDAYGVFLRAVAMHVEALIVRLFVAEIGLKILADLGVPDRFPALRDHGLLEAAFSTGEESRFAGLAAAHVYAARTRGEHREAEQLTARALAEIRSFSDVSDPLITFALCAGEDELGCVGALVPAAPMRGPRGLHQDVIRAIVATRSGGGDANDKARAAVEHARRAQAPLFEALGCELLGQHAQAAEIYRTIGARGQLARLKSDAAPRRRRAKIDSPAAS